jgi:hypothetical protein
LVRKDVSDKENLPSTIINFPKKIVNPKTQPDEALLPQDSENADTALVTEKEADEILVAEAFEFLKKTFREHFHEAMVEAGRYLIKMFYDDNYEFARLKKRIKKESLRQLILKLQENSGDAPSKTWIYDAVKLAVDEHDFESFRLYGKLGLSQKLLLTHVKDDGEKRALIEEAAENNYTVIDLRKRIREEKGKLKPKNISVKEKIAFDMLESLEPEKIKKLKDQIETLEEKIRNELAMHQENLKMINEVLGHKVETDQDITEIEIGENQRTNLKPLFINLSKLREYNK